MSETSKNGIIWSKHVATNGKTIKEAYRKAVSDMSSKTLTAEQMQRQMDAACEFKVRISIECMGIR